jgi:predicted RNase H-like HicB family nuclease
LQFNIETERESDGRWIAEVREIPGALAYGKSEK